MWIRSLADADASCGAKAVGLARLIAAGLPVPDGFVVASSAFHEVARIAQVAPNAIDAIDATDATDAINAIGHEVAAAEQRIAQAPIPPALEREVRALASALGRLAVRSSASLEDGVRGAAAGVFASVTDVAPDAVWDAIRMVWTSALTPLAIAYARRRAAALSIAVIVQRFVRGERETVYTRPVGAPTGDELWCQRDRRLDRAPRSTDRVDAVLALAAEAAIGASHGADVELVLQATPHGTTPWIVQARPIVHPVARPRTPPPPVVLAPLVHDGRRWTWDIAHNPDPLSPAQAGLVEQVDRAPWSPHALRVCGGYLYTTPRAPRDAPAPPTGGEELASRIAAIEARFVLVLGDVETVAEAVDRYLAFMQIWTCELSPLVASARAQLLERLARDGHPSERIPGLAAEMIGPRQVLRDPVMAPAWDVAVPTFAERATDARSIERPPHPRVPVPPGHAADVELARAAADAAERDDLWFARAQWMVRRALLARGAELALHHDDIFWLPLDEVITLRTLDPDGAHRRASAARAAHARSSAWDMPRIVHGTLVAAPTETTLRGVGVGSRVIGRVVRFASLGAATAVSASDVVVTRAITPALAMIVDGCAALISETGGLLDHGAALARELGITCVVGCEGAWTQLADGMLVSVDGDAGLVGLA